MPDLQPFASQQPLLLEAMVSHARTAPDKVFIKFETTRDKTALTYGAVLRHANRFGRLYTARGLQPGDVVLISLKTSPDLIASFFGALLVGCVPSLMPFPSAKQDPRIFWSSHNELFRHLGGGLIVTYPENLEAIRLNIEPGLMHTVSAEEARDYDDAWLTPVPCHADARACLQHSSGTTGLKKGVSLTFGEIAAQVTSYAGVLDLTDADVIASWLPLYHDMGFIACFLMPATVGATVIMLDPFEWIMSPVSLLHVIDQHRATYCWLPNFAFNHLVNSVADDQTAGDLSSIRAFINCSEPCKADTFLRFAQRFSTWNVRPEQLQVCYAMAETVFAVTQTRLDTLNAGVDWLDSDRASNILAAGSPIPGIEVRIAGPADEVLTDGEAGEIAVRGPFVFTGYNKQTQHDPSLFRDGYFYTGDVGFVRDGQLFVQGRKKDLIIVCGRNLFAHDIEALVCEVDGVKPGRSVALGLYNDSLGSEDLVIIAEKADPAADEKAIRRHIKQTIESMIAIVPKKIMVVQDGWLIKSTSGKISRKENLERYKNVQGGASAQ